MNDNASSSTASSAKTEKATDETIKETFESIIIAFILAFVFRAYIVEAFIIPTGSMAPTLLGEHVVVRCDQCGYRFMADPDDRDRAVKGDNNKVIKTALLQRDVITTCPMCYHHVTLPRGTRTSSGDRILVHKYLYSVTEPKRWDVVVFKNPDEPDVNYIKRLVGLPGDDLWIIEGNIYIRPEGGNWRIARKSDREAVQRAVWQPIYHSAYVPMDKGRDREEPNAIVWSTPWKPVNGEGWELEARHSYEFPSSSEGTIRFDFSQFGGGRPVWFAYNQIRNSPQDEAVEDVRIAANFEPKQRGLAIQISTTARLDDTAVNAPPEKLTASLNADGSIALSRQSNNDAAPRIITQAQLSALQPGETRRVELWFVDQELSLWVDGRRELAASFDVPTIEMASKRMPLLPRDPRNKPDVTITVSGSPVTLHEVELDRDIYYVSGSYVGGMNAGQPGTGVLQKSLDKDADGDLHVVLDGHPVHIENDQFFCLGDNSPMSHDGRYWTSLDPWVEDRLFDGHEQRIGIVPRKLMMGRAFFVYFPAPYGLAPDKNAIFPNFGDMRFIH